MSNQGTGKHLLSNTKIEAYVVRAQVSKTVAGKAAGQTIFVEAPFAHAKRVALLAAMLKFHEIEKSQDFDYIIQGLRTGRAASFVNQVDEKISVEEYDYIIDQSEKDTAMQDGEYLSMKDVLSAVFQLIKKNPKDYIHQPIFLKFRNFDEEFAAMLGAVNELVLEGVEEFKDEHIQSVITTINGVHLMGYPPKRMMG